MEATTTRASTVIRSMPTSETRTQASITMPLSSTRSRTSMRLVPPTVRSTGIVHPPVTLGLLACASQGDRPAAASAGGRRRGGDPALQYPHLTPQRLVLGDERPAARREVRLLRPPVETDLPRLVDRAHDQPDPDRQQLHLGQRHLDVPG